MTYKTSKDYERLWEIYKRGEGFHIFAYISYYGNDSRNSCIIYPTEGKLVIALWSDELLQYRHKTEFLYDCKRFNLSFLDPEPPTCETCKSWYYRYKNIIGKFGKCRNLKNLESIDEGQDGRLMFKSTFGCIFHELKESE